MRILVLVIALWMCGITAAARAAVGDTLPGLPDPDPGGSGIIHPLQGDPANFPPSGVPVQRDMATISYPGITDEQNLLQVYGACVYIDNYTNTAGLNPITYFVPLNSLAEWVAFVSNPPAHVTITPGCPNLDRFTVCNDDKVKISSPHRVGDIFTATDIGERSTYTLRCDASAAVYGPTSCGHYTLIGGPCYGEP